MKIFKNNDKVLLHDNKAIIVPNVYYHITREIDNGVFKLPANNFTFTLPAGVSSLGTKALEYAFYNCKKLIEIDFNSSNEIELEDYSLYGVCLNCTNLTTISNLKLPETISKSYCLYTAFQGCTSLSSANFISTIKTISGRNALYRTFRDCTNLQNLNLSNLEVLSAYGSMYSTFEGCTGLSGTITFTNLTTISGAAAMDSTFSISSGKTNYITAVNFPALNALTGSSALQDCFKNRTALTSISFPALTSTSFGISTNQFNLMLVGITGCTVHFPSNLQSIIGGWNDVIAGFGGTNTTILFDLPATE